MSHWVFVTVTFSFWPKSTSGVRRQQRRHRPRIDTGSDRAMWGSLSESEGSEWVWYFFLTQTNDRSSVRGAHKTVRAYSEPRFPTKSAVLGYATEVTLLVSAHWHLSVRSDRVCLTLSAPYLKSAKGLNTETVVLSVSHPSVKSVSQSVYPSSIVLPIIHSSSQSVSQSVRHSFIHSFIHSVSQSVTQSVSQSVRHSFIHSVTHSFIQSVSISTFNPPDIHSFIQSVSQSVGQSSSQSVSTSIRSFIHSVSETVIHWSVYLSSIRSFSQ